MGSKKRWLLIISGVALIALIGGRAYFMYEQYEYEQYQNDPTPRIGFDRTQDPDNETAWCAVVVVADSFHVSRFLWEDIRVKEYDSPEPIVHEQILGMTGEVRIGDEVCGFFRKDGYYDLIYKPEGQVFHLFYPDCVHSWPDLEPAQERSPDCVPPGG